MKELGMKIKLNEVTELESNKTINISLEEIIISI